jgi:hypothetical protein
MGSNVTNAIRTKLILLTFDPLRVTPEYCHGEPVEPRI